MSAHWQSHTSSIAAVGVSIERGDRTVFSDVGVTLTAASRLAVVGPNGVGKSTLFAVLAGDLMPDAGTVTRTPATTTVGFVRQELDRSVAPTVHGLIAARAGVAEAQRVFDDATRALGEGELGADNRYAAALEAWLAVGAPDFDARLESVADEVGLERRLLQLDPRVLSGGQAARVGLVSVMLSRFDITLLDEPTNDLDLVGLDLLEAWITDREGGVAVISHDRAFLERTVSSVLEIDEHAHTARLFNGGWDAFMAERATQRALAEERYATYTTERDRLSARAQQQREWASQGLSKARKNPSDGDNFVRNFKIDQTEKLAGKAKATLRSLDRLEVVDKPWEGWDLRFTIAEAPRGATVVAALDQAVIRRGEWSLGPLDLEIRWAERVALAGPNGCGKSSLIGALLGKIAVESGSARLGSGVVVGELDQRRGRLSTSDDRLVDVFQGLTGQTVAEARSVLAKFGLDADAVDRPAVALSPGERTRAQLAHFQATGVNLLVLDEPTNHLDLPAIEQLESALETYTGTLVLVTHDRRLLERVTLTRTIDVTSLQDL